MLANDIEALAKGILASGKIETSPGLEDFEWATLEERHRVRFPDDLKALLSLVLPIGSEFPDWRGGRGLQERFNAPVVGIIDTVRDDTNWWYPEWGKRPSVMSEALALAKAEMLMVPRLIPLCSHQYVPQGLRTSVVFSIMDIDVVEMARDLSSYFAMAFSLPGGLVSRQAAEAVPFWSAMSLS